MRMKQEPQFTCNTADTRECGEGTPDALSGNSEGNSRNTATDVPFMAANHIAEVTGRTDSAEDEVELMVSHEDE